MVKPGWNRGMMQNEVWASRPVEAREPLSLTKNDPEAATPGSFFVKPLTLVATGRAEL